MQQRSERLRSPVRIVGEIVADTQVSMGHQRHGLIGDTDEIHELEPSRNKERGSADPIVVSDRLVPYRFKLVERLIEGTRGRQVGSRDATVEVLG